MVLVAYAMMDGPDKYVHLHSLARASIARMLKVGKENNNDFCQLQLLFFQIYSFFKKNSFRHTIRVSNGLAPDQARRTVGPDLGPNRL